MRRRFQKVAVFGIFLIIQVGTIYAQFHNTTVPNLEAYLKVAEDKGASALHRAQSLMVLGEIEKAETFLRQVIVNSDSESYEPAKQLVHRLIMLGEFECAIRLLEELESISPAPEIERYMRGVLLEENGQIIPATSILRQIVSQEVGDYLSLSPDELKAAAYRYRKNMPAGPVLYQAVRKFRGVTKLEMEPVSAKEATLFGLIHLIEMNSATTDDALPNSKNGSIITAGRYVLGRDHDRTFLESVITATREDYPEIAFSAAVDAKAAESELLALADALDAVNGAIPFRKLVSVAESAPDGPFRDSILTSGMRWVAATSDCRVRNTRVSALANAMQRPNDGGRLKRLIENELKNRDEEFVHRFDTSKRGFWPLSFHFPSDFGIPTSLFEWLAGSDFSSGAGVIAEVLESGKSDQFKDLRSLLKWKLTKEFDFSSGSDFARACHLANALNERRYDDLAAGLSDFQATAQDEHKKYVGLIIIRLLAEKPVFRNSIGEQGRDLARWIQFMPLSREESAEVVSNLRKIEWDDVVLTVVESDVVVSIGDIDSIQLNRAIGFMGLRRQIAAHEEHIPLQPDGTLRVTESKWNGGAITINWINNAPPLLAKSAALNTLNRFAHERFKEGYTNKPVPDWLQKFLLTHFTEDEIFDQINLRNGIGKRARKGVILDLLNQPEKAADHFRSLLSEPGGEEMGAVKIQLASIISRTGDLDDFIEALNLEDSVAGSFPAAIPQIPVSTSPVSKEYCNLLSGSLRRISESDHQPGLKANIIERVITYLGPPVKIDMGDEELCETHFDLSRQCLEWDELRGLGVVSLLKNHRHVLFDKEKCSAKELWAALLQAAEYAAKQGSDESLFPAHAKRHSVEIEWSYGQEIARLAAATDVIENWKTQIAPLLSDFAKASPTLAPAIKAQFQLRFGSQEEFHEAASALFDENGATYDLTQEMLRITESRGFDKEIETIENRFVAESAAAGVYAFTGDRVDKLLEAGEVERAKRLYRNGLVALLGSVPADPGLLKQFSKSAFKTQTRFDFGRRLLGDGTESGVLLPIAFEAVAGANLEHSQLKNLGLPMDRILRPNIDWEDESTFLNWPFFCGIEDFNPISLPTAAGKPGTTVFNSFANDLRKINGFFPPGLRDKLNSTFGGKLLLAITANPELTAAEFLKPYRSELQQLSPDKQEAIKLVFDPTGSDQ